MEAGGHVAGTVSTMTLVPRIVDAVAPTPVVAAGGIADARGVVAALALGAEGEDSGRGASVGEVERAFLPAAAGAPFYRNVGVVLAAAVLGGEGARRWVGEAL